MLRAAILEKYFFHPDHEKFTIGPSTFTLRIHGIIRSFKFICTPWKRLQEDNNWWQGYIGSRGTT